MIQPSDGGFLDELQTWLERVPVVGDLVTCRSTGDESQGARSRSLRPAKSFVEARAEPPLVQFRRPPLQDSLPGTNPAEDSEIARRKRELEDDLASDLNRLADERKRGLHRLDWELAEAVENLHAETARKANERIERHRKILADLEGGRCMDGSAPRVNGCVRHNAHEEDEGSDAGESEDDEDEDAAGTSRFGVLGHLVNFIHGSSGATGDEHAGTSRSRSRDSDGEELDDDDYDGCAPRWNVAQQPAVPIGTSHRPPMGTMGGPSVREPHFVPRAPSLDTVPFIASGGSAGYQQQWTPQR